MAYACKKCRFIGETGLDVARHVRAEHKPEQAEIAQPASEPTRRTYKKREKKTVSAAVAVDAETKLIFDAYALFDASDTSIDQCLSVLEYLRNRYEKMLEAASEGDAE